MLDLEGRELEIGEGELIVGRSRSCNITLRDPTASRHHVMLHVGDGHVMVRDLQSSNGSFVNGRRLDGELDLEDGDCLSIGETDLVVRIARSSSEAAHGEGGCRHCGAELPSAATYCPGCGKKVDPDYETMPFGAGPGVSAEDLTAPVHSRPEPPPLPPPAESSPPPLGDVELAQRRGSSASHRSFPPPAGFWVRTLAALIDGAVVWLVSLVASLPFGGPTSDLGQVSVAVAGLVVGAAIPIIGWARWGTTPGKAALRLVVCTTDGEVGLTAPQALLRWLGYFPSLLFLGIGFFMVGLSTSKRGLHDHLAGTYVGRDRS